MAKIDENNFPVAEDDEILFSHGSLDFNELKKRYKGKSIVFDLRNGQEREIFKFFAENINFFELKKITVLYDNSISAPFGIFPLFVDMDRCKVNYKFEMTPVKDVD